MPVDLSQLAKQTKFSKLVAEQTERLKTLTGPKNISEVAYALVELGLLAAEKKCLTEQECRKVLGRVLLAKIEGDEEPDDEPDEVIEGDPNSEAGC